MKACLYTFVFTALLLLLFCRQTDPVPITKIPVEQWHHVTQPIELGSWVLRGEHECTEVPKTSEWTMRRFGFTEDQFNDKILVDIGPGPVGRLTWLAGKFIAIEPLASELKALPFCRLDQYKTIYEQPAESRIDELIGTVDQIMAINSLDHAFDLDEILGNMFLYLKPGGRAFVSVHLGDPTEDDPYHPLKLDRATMLQLFQRHGFQVEREDTGRCTPTEDSWGSGVTYHWWLVKPKGSAR